MDACQGRRNLNDALFWKGFYFLYEHTVNKIRSGIKPVRYQILYFLWRLLVKSLRKPMVAETWASG